jgi:predicted GNAT family acetyltransferase
VIIEAGWPAAELHLGGARTSQVLNRGYSMSLLPTLRHRCARLNRGRVWIRRAGDEKIFKVDVLTEVRSISYIEGAWVNPAYRGWGICRQALNSLHQKLYTDGQTVGCFAEAGNQKARDLYLNAGYRTKVSSKIYS